MIDLLGLVILGGDALGTVIEVLLFIFIVAVLLYLIRMFISRW